MNELAIIDHMAEVNQVATEYLKGQNETQISKALGIPRNRVISLLDEWKTNAANNEAVRQRARQALAGADLHFNDLTRKLYETIEDADQGIASGGLNANQGYTLRLNALKMISDLEKSRMDMLQKAGLLENQELAEQLIAQEEQQKAIMKIITEVVGACPRCKPQVLQRMSGLNNDGPTVIVEGAVE